MIGLLRVFLFTLSLPAVFCQESDCHLGATFGSTKINVTWEPCEVTGAEVFLYDISLEDNSKQTFNQSATVECRAQVCQYSFELVKPCLNYTITLVMTLKNGNTSTYTTVTDRTEEEIPTAVTLDGVNEGFTIVNTTLDSISISWFPPEIGKYCVTGYAISWWTSYGSDLTLDTGNVTDVDNIFDEAEQSYLISNLSACSEYQLMVTPLYSQSNKLGHGVVHSGTRTLHQDPGPPRDLAVTYRGYDFLELEWRDTEDTSCVRGVSVSCSVQSDEGGAVVSSGPADEARKGRVTHLAPCTEYSCSVAYPDKDGAWSIVSSVTDYTWVKGVTISRPTRVRYYMAARDLHVTWGGPELGGKCVTEYVITYSGTSVSVSADSPYSHVISDILPSTFYNISLTASSSGWGDDVTGDTINFTVDTGDFDLLGGRSLE